MRNFDRQLPLSGEIMDGSSARPGKRAGGRRPDFVDAEFEEIGLPVLTREEITERLLRDSVAERLSADGMWMLRRAGSKTARQKGGVLFYIGAAAIAIMAFWISGGYAIFPGFTQTAAQTGADMRIDNITTSSITVNKHRLLLVSGTVVNSGEGRVESPPVRITVKTKSGNVVSYHLGSKGWPLDPGQSMPFSSRLDAPASGVESVQVGLSGKGTD